MTNRWRRETSDDAFHLADLMINGVAARGEAVLCPGPFAPGGPESLFSLMHFLIKLFHPRDLWLERGLLPLQVLEFGEPSAPVSLALLRLTTRQPFQ